MYEWMRPSKPLFLQFDLLLTWQQCFGSLKMKMFETRFQSLIFWTRHPCHGKWKFAVPVKTVTTTPHFVMAVTFSGLFTLEELNLHMRLRWPHLIRSHLNAQSTNKHKRSFQFAKTKCIIVALTLLKEWEHMQPRPPLNVVWAWVHSHLDLELPVCDRIIWDTC